jgi:hypothetical protein
MILHRGFVLNLAICLAVALQAGAPTIGVAVANGRFLLDRSAVVGNGNILEGAVIETQDAMADLSLNNGQRIRLGKESRGRVYSDRLILEKGAGQVTGANSAVIAGRLRIVP